MTDEFFTSKPEVDHIYEVMHIKLYLYFSFFIVEYFHFLPEPILLMQLLGQTYVSWSYWHLALYSITADFDAPPSWFGPL